MTSGQALGNITDFASPSLAAQTWRVDNVSLRYRLLDTARDLLPNEKVAKCLRIPTNGGDVEIWKDTETNHAHIKGVGRCGRAWVCPVCAAKVAMGRRAELEDGMGNARALGWIPVFVTYTARHTREDTALEMREKTRKAQRQLKSGKWWQTNVKALGLEGVITGIETTYGHESGWHVHYHAIMFFNAFVDLEELEEKLYHRWFAVLQKNGLDCDREHGVMVQSGNHAANYITKWGLENELAGEYKKAKNGNFTPFDLLRKYEQGEEWAGVLFKEFAAAFKGVSQLRWGKGLKATLAVNVATDEELAESEVSDNSVKMATLEWEQYQRILKKGKPGVIGQLLMVAECGEMALFVWLLEFGIFLEPG